MTLEEAVRILNLRAHRETGVWEVYRGRAYARHEQSDHDELEEFEAIAVAEKYQRESLRALTDTT